jgi:hypothetical protein
MRDFHDVKILRGVSHVLEPRNPKALLVLSEAELPLDGGVGDMLAAHVDGGLHDAQAKAAVFADRRPDQTSNVCARLLSARPRLVELSQQLASALYAITESDDRVSDGTLAVLLCQATGSDGARVRFLALLKLDPSAKLRTVTDNDPVTGKRWVRYEIDTATLPSKNEKIQKCVFVRVVDSEAKYEMLLVDRQRRTDVVSKFWASDFLGAKLVLDASERTKQLYRGLRAGRNDVEQDLDATELAALDQVIDGTVVRSSVNLDDLIHALPVSEPIRERIDAKVSQHLPDREFDLDPAVASQFIRRRTYHGDNGLRVSVSAEFSHMIHIEDVEPSVQETRLRRVSFETRTWREN